MSPEQDASLTIAVVYPDLLGTYGDGGNGLVLARRASWRGIDAELIQAQSGRPLPSADIYCIGGGEDGPEVRSAEALRQDGTLARAVGNGAVVLGVCAGFQLLGTSFPDSHDRPHEGLGLLDVSTRKGTGRRAVGEAMAEATADSPMTVDGSRLPALNGFENHSAVTSLGPGSRPVAQVVRGVGNGAGDRTEGAWAGRVLGTYLHGPVMARNAWLADELLSAALGFELAPIDDVEERLLAQTRIASLRRSARPLARMRRRIL